MCVNSIDFRRGNAHPNLVLLGACPGQGEWEADPQRPFAGRSGVNLRSLLEVLLDLPNKEVYGLQPGDFLSTSLDDYTLMNSHAEAKWPAEYRRSTPRMSEVGTRENRLRLTNQLRSVGARVVVGLGRPVNDAQFGSQRERQRSLESYTNAGACWIYISSATPRFAANASMGVRYPRHFRGVALRFQITSSMSAWV